ncbi:GTP 3',8-cyclase MoaA [Rugamonas apoptosis]|uniref:GTP 3',8-cyclase n=1 Tax=Rugamonas apoptosis TaxID=2758570 RepID=A0A7W2F8F8_9BURK|nr:GTP 3',8-cyclase MoaA [Rugamonas apoptosis]MBA5687041.1 GTP 3',8-cyclase MoaA [Rugamonas apoptosis]
MNTPSDLRDTRGRPLKDLRLSVIDQCNFRCPYCMPKERYGPDFPFMPSSERLSFEQLTRLARTFVSLGVEKIRITGGEPLLRKDLPRLIESLAAMRTLDGRPLDIALTTNGSLLAARAQSLKDAGLRRVTVSLDSLDEALGGRMNGVGFPVARILEGIAAAQRVGLAPVKVNTVIERGVNDSQILPLVRHFRHSGVQLRFIEYMDVGGASRWNPAQVLEADAMRAIVGEHYRLVPDSAAQGHDTAELWQHADGAGAIGFISSMSHPFCGSCVRARVAADGKVYLCLFARHGTDLRPWLGAGQEAALAEQITALWQARADRYSELRDSTASAPVTHRIVRMSLVGG